jgi:acetolactate synthase-1/2/3 large subunit
VVVFVDDEYGIVARHQREHRGESVGTDLTNPDLVAFAESFGIEARRATSAAELHDALGLVEADGMALIEVPVE